MPTPNQALLRGVRLRRDEIEDFSDFPFSIPAIHDLKELFFDPKVTFLVGENGSGKSTLLEGIAQTAGFNAEGGSKQFSFAKRPTESALHRFLQPIRGTRREKTGFFLRAETMFNVATVAEDLGLEKYNWGDMHACSHGEMFLSIMNDRFYRNGLYLLDEPEAALSPTRQLSALRIIHDLVNDGAQFIISTHSPILMAYPDARILQLGEHGIRRVEYQETDHFQITQAFLQNPERMLERLFDDED